MLAAWERGLLGAAPAARAAHSGDWVDYNGHVHESRYLQLFGDATDALLGELGVDADYLAAAGATTRSRRTSRTCGSSRPATACT